MIDDRYTLAVRRRDSSVDQFFKPVLIKVSLNCHISLFDTGLFRSFRSRNIRLIPKIQAHRRNFF